MSKGGKYLKPKATGGKKKGNAKKTALVVACIVLALLLAVMIGVYAYINGLFGKMNQVEVEKIDYAALATETYETTEATEAAEATEVTTEATTEATTEPTEPHVASSADYINFLVVGQAAREGETKNQDRSADTAILFTLNTHEKTLTMTSLLRDTLIRGATYKGHTWGGIKLTTVYNMGYQWNGVAGSMEVMNTTLFLNFGIEVDHNFEVDFNGFIDLINLMGGVDIELTEAEAAYLNADDFWVYKDVEPGWNNLSGMPALSFVRMRKVNNNESDILRTDRQRRFIEAIIDKLKTKSVSELMDLVNAALPMITTSMSNDELMDMALKVLPMLSELELVKGGTCPANYEGDMLDIYKDGRLHSVLYFNEQETKAYMRAITEGEGVIAETAE